MTVKATMGAKPRRRIPSSKAGSGRPPAAKTLEHASILEQARRAGLLDGDKSGHVSFRAPPALIEAAKRETGVTSTSELGVLALALLATPDPVAAFFRRTEARLGPDHDLVY